MLALFKTVNQATSRHLSPTTWQAGFLFGVDMVTNVADYGFHAYLGWALIPADFAIVQTVNGALLIVLAAFAVLQPVVARYAAEARSTTGQAADSRAIFQVYLRQSALLGLALTLAVWLGQRPLAGWLNVPATAVALSAAMMVLALTRPVVAGMLQGQERFIAFGTVRSAFALGRLALAVLLVGVLGGGAGAGVAAIPLGGLLSLALGLWLLGRAVWQRGPKPPRQLLWRGWRLSLAAFIAYAAYMGLLNVDLIWVNRTFPADLAGNYAAAVVLRRVLAVLPGAVIVILYPRVVSRVAEGHLPDGVLAKAAAVVVTANVLVTALYFAAGPLVVRLMFGPNYPAAAALLGWMGVAMIGYGMVAIWLNLFLATRPWVFVALLAATVVTQVGLLAGASESLLEVTAVFGLAGWFLAIAGLLLYWFWLRPRLVRPTTDNIICGIRVQKGNRGMTKLAEEQKRQLDHDGYVLLPGVLSEVEAGRLIDHLEALWAAEGEVASRENYVEAEARRLANLANKGDIFRPVLAHPLVLAAVEQVIGANVRLSMLNARDARPHAGRRQPFHCDTDSGGKPDEQGYYACTAVWMLDDFTLDNGATYLVPGTHRTHQVPKEALADIFAPHPEEIVLTGRRGDVAVFNGHCWHAGGQNQTDGPRRAILAHYLRAGLPRADNRRQHLDKEVRERMSPRELELLGLDEA